MMTSLGLRGPIWRTMEGPRSDNGLNMTDGSKTIHDADIEEALKIHKDLEMAEALQMCEDPGIDFDMVDEDFCEVLEMMEDLDLAKYEEIDEDSEMVENSLV